MDFILGDTMSFEELMEELSEEKKKARISVYCPTIYAQCSSCGYVGEFYLRGVRPAQVILDIVIPEEAEYNCGKKDCGTTLPLGELEVKGLEDLAN